MSLVDQINLLATALGDDRQTDRATMGSLAALSTTDKTSLVAAINEVFSTGGSIINDAATATTSVWSSDKTNTEIVAAVTAVINAAPGALDTLDELAAAIGDDANFAATIATELAARVRFDAAQTLTAGEQTQAQTNMGVTASSDIGNVATDFVATYNTALTT